MTTVKFKRIAEGHYEANHQGYEVEVSKNYESKNWSLVVIKPNGSILVSDVCYTYSDCKEWASELILKS
jgi:hypothetical protein